MAEASRSGNKSPDNLHTAITEFKTESGIWGIAARTNPIFQSSHVMLRMCNFEGPNFRDFKTEISRRKQINNPNKNTNRAAGIVDKIRSLLARRPEWEDDGSTSLSLSCESPAPVVKIRNKQEARARNRPSNPSQERGPADLEVTRS